MATELEAATTRAPTSTTDFPRSLFTAAVGTEEISVKYRGHP